MKLRNTSKCIKLETRGPKLEEQIDANFAYEYNGTVIMAGTVPAAKQGEDCQSTVREQILEHLQRLRY